MFVPIMKDSITENFICFDEEGDVVMNIFKDDYTPPKNVGKYHLAIGQMLESFLGNIASDYKVVGEWRHASSPNWRYDYAVLKGEEVLCVIEVDEQHHFYGNGYDSDVPKMALVRASSIPMIRLSTIHVPCEKASRKLAKYLKEAIYGECEWKFAFIPADKYQPIYNKLVASRAEPLDSFKLQNPPPVILPLN